MMETHRDWLDRSVDLLWGLVLLCLPVTSFPFIPLLGSGTQVRPLSIYPLVLLLPLLLLQILRKKVNAWHPVFISLGIFLLMMIVTACLGALLAPVELRGQTYFDRALRALITVVIGLGFFLAALWSLRSQQQLRSSLKWLYLGLVISFIWGMIQFASYKGFFLDEVTIDRIQKMFSVSGISFKNLRVPGFALEPSWLAGELAVIYFPWLFGSLLTGYHLTRWRWLEYVLSLMTLVLLVVTYSRSGLLMVIFTSLLTLVLFGREKIRQLWHWFITPFSSTGFEKSSRTLHVSIRLVLLLVVFAVATLAGKVLSENQYFSQIWKSKKSNLVEYVIDIYAGPRLAYVWSGMETFNQHPWTGVGLGAGGFYLYENLPDWAKTSVPEISNHLSPMNTAYPNTKNLFVRIISETG
ncbi:MAG: O-antigen ligase family protein, partial [Anaerolineales bacterium]